MNRDLATTEQLKQILAQLTDLTETNSLHWEKQTGSSHRYAKSDGVLLILGPGEPLENRHTPRYLHITPLFSQKWLEINSLDLELHDSLMQLIAAVEAATLNQPPTDPFALTSDLLKLLDK